MKNLPLTEILETSTALLIARMIFVAAKKLTQSTGPFRFTVFYARLLSGILFVFIPLTNASVSILDLFHYTQFTNLKGTLFCTLVFSILAVLVTSRSAANEENLKSHPQLRMTHWNTGYLFCNTLTWIFYVGCYEFLLRGLLLSASLQSLSLVFAILVNMIIYSIAHLPNRREAIGAIPFGILLCLLTYATGNIWSAIVIHATLATSNDIFSIRAGAKINTMKLTNPI